MGSTTRIEWTDATWSPVTGCTKVSEGCANCYAERVANRQIGTFRWDPSQGPWRKFSDVRCHPERLDQPLHWRKPRRIFVCSMGDLFHPHVRDSFINQVFEIMNTCRNHTFQVLTKRPDRMQGYCSAMNPPLPNVWFGVSCENQAAADERIPLLLQTPAAVRFVSYEPALGPLDISKYLGTVFLTSTEFVNAIRWVIAGGESGPEARPMHPDWVRSVQRQCQAAGVPFFFKQWGEWACVEGEELTKASVEAMHPQKHIVHLDASTCGVGQDVYGNVDETLWYRWMCRVGKKTAGRLLDGREWNEYPKEIRANDGQN